MACKGQKVKIRACGSGRQGQHREGGGSGSLAQNASTRRPLFFPFSKAPKRFTVDLGRAWATESRGALVEKLLFRREVEKWTSPAAGFLANQDLWAQGG